MSATVTVVASRTRSNAERFAAAFGVPVVAASYEEAAAASQVDALYIATPPSEHEAHALAGISAGKPVLVEKPFAMNSAAAARIIEIAREKRVFCMEGMWTRFLPLIGVVRDRLAAGDIGEIRAFRGEFCGASRPDVAISNFDPSRGGGALMHKGVYAVSLARLFLGPIEEVDAMAWIGSTGVDEDCSLVLRHRTGSISTVRASNRTMGANDVMIYGTKGLLHIKSPIARPPAARITHYPESSGGGGNNMGRLERLLAEGFGQGLKQRGDDLIRALRSTKSKRVSSYYRGNGFHYEAEALVREVAASAIESDVMPLDESLEIMTVIDKTRAVWQKGVGSMRVGIIGCGFVFDKYMPTWGNHSHLSIAGVTDIDESRVDAVTRYYGLKGYKDNAALLADPDIDIVANFTPIKAHYEVTKAALEAGKHVYSEKPLVTQMDQARELVALAESRGLRLSCAPSNVLGATSQTMWKAVADGAIGDPRLAHAEFDAGPSYLMHTGQPQRPGDGAYFPYLHERLTMSPTGAPFPWFKEFEMGCTYEHVGYHLSWMCAMFGPVKSVTAFSKQIMPDKTNRPLDPPNTADYSVATLDFHSGMTGRVTCSITGPGDTSMRIFGNRGMLYAETYGDYKCPVYLEPFARLSIKAKHVKAVRSNALVRWLLGINGCRLPLVKTASAGSHRVATSDPWWNVKGWLARRKQAELTRQDKCIGIAELATAIATNRPHFPSHAFTLHLTELTLAIQAAGTRSQTHILETWFDPIDMPEQISQAGIDYNKFRKSRFRTRVLEGVLDRARG